MSFPYFFSSVVAVAAFGCVLLAPGYLAVRCGGLAVGAGRRQLLWSLLLGAPLATMLVVIFGAALGNRGTGAVFGLLDVAAVVLWVRSGPRVWGRVQPVVWAGLAVLGLFLLLAGAPVRVGSGLWEPIASSDWSVRVPLINSAIRGGLPLVNPFYGIDGHVVPLRYYWYWYGLCGVVGSVFRLPGRAVIAGGTVWAAWLTLACIALLLQTLFRPVWAGAAQSRRRLLAGAALAMPVLGLDVLQVVYFYLKTHMLYPEMEWWRAPSALTPSFQTMWLYAPHHTFGVCACLVGFVLLVLPLLGLPVVGVTDRATVLSTIQDAGPGVLVRGALAGVCFASVAGTSTYVALCFCIVGALLVVERAVARDWHTLKALAVATAVAAVLSVGFVRLMLAPQPGAVHVPFVSVALRSWHALSAWMLGHGRLSRLPFAGRITVRSVLYLLLELSEGGFLLLVVLYRARLDLPQKRALATARRLQWVLLFGFLLPALLLSSSTIASNDLGFHAAFVMRMIGVLWAAPLLADAVWDRPWRRRVLRLWQGKVAVAFVLLGLLSQGWQILLQRFGPVLPVALIPSQLPSGPQLGARYLAAWEANAAINRLLPPDARILTNPWSPQRSMGMLYLNRQTIAPEPGCMTAFGGNPVLCAQALPSLANLFAEELKYPPGMFPAAKGTASQARGFDAVCREQGATAVLVSAEDGAWRVPGSWVWTRPAAYSSARQRLLLCGDAAKPNEGA